MNLISTLVRKPKDVKKILIDVPENSVVLLPEEPSMPDAYIKRISKERNLFVIYNHDIKQKNNRYIAMKGVDDGELEWIVRKYWLWKTDEKYFSRPSHPEPFVEIRGKRAIIEVCYGMSKIAGFGRLFEYGKHIKNYNPELLLFPSNWEFKFKIPIGVMESAIKNMPSVKVAMFSNTREYASIITRDESKKIMKTGWLSHSLA